MRYFLFPTALLALSVTSAVAWSQCDYDEFPRLDASDGGWYHWLGRSISISGDTVLVGAPGADGVVLESGAAYVYTKTPSGWVESTKLTAAAGEQGDTFARSVSLDLDTAVAGAPQDIHFTHKGSASVFERSPSGWMERQRLVAWDSPTFGFGFGISVDVDGERVIVGAEEDDTVGNEAGAAYVFVRTPSGWAPEAKLTASDGAASDRFGTSVAIHGDTVLVGAPFKYGSAYDAGAAYVYERDASGWQEVAKLTGDNPNPNDKFGFAVSIHGDVALVAAPWRDTPQTNAGAVYVFERSRQGWTKTQELLPDVPAYGDLLGFSLQVEGDRAVCGAHLHDFSTDQSGAAYVFDKTPTGWSQVAKLRASDAESYTQYGMAVALSGDRVAVGSWLDTPFGVGSGSAYVYQTVLTSSNFCLANPNSTGLPAALSANGCNSVLANDVELVAAPVPNQPGLFFYGGTQTQVLFGNGFRCVALPLHRLPLEAASGNALRHSLDVFDPPSPAAQITAGTTWYFQAWYRDPAALGATFNTSDGLEITFSF